MTKLRKVLLCVSVAMVIACFSALSGCSVPTTSPTTADDEQVVLQVDDEADTEREKGEEPENAEPSDEQVSGENSADTPQQNVASSTAGGSGSTGGSSFGTSCDIGDIGGPHEIYYVYCEFDSTEFDVNDAWLTVHIGIDREKYERMIAKECANGDSIWLNGNYARQDIFVYAQNSALSENIDSELYSAESENGKDTGYYDREYRNRKYAALCENGTDCVKDGIQNIDSISITDCFDLPFDKYNAYNDDGSIAYCYSTHVHIAPEMFTVPQKHSLSVNINSFAVPTEEYRQSEYFNEHYKAEYPFYESYHFSHASFTYSLNDGVVRLCAQYPGSIVYFSDVRVLEPVTEIPSRISE